MAEQRTPAEVLDGLAAQVRYEGDSEEEVYDASEGFKYNRTAFSSVREAFIYRAQGLVREIARTWAPLGTPLDAGRIAAWGEGPAEYATLLLALFRRGNLVAYLAVRELAGGFGRLRLVLGVGVSGAGERQPGGGEGDEGRAWLSVISSRGLGQLRK